MPSELAKRRFCSQECGNLARKRRADDTSGRTATCQQCAATFEVPAAWVRNGRRKYCSKLCRHRANQNNRNRLGKAHTAESRAKMGANPPIGERSSQWKGGRYLSKGYVHVLARLLPAETQALIAPMVGKNGYVMEHRVVAAVQLGRPLTTDDVVHHVSGEKADNRPENLVVTPRADHTMEHREFERKFRALQSEVEALRAENADLRSRLEPSLMAG
jgi:hypothetical protein